MSMRADYSFPMMRERLYKENVPYKSITFFGMAYSHEDTRFPPHRLYDCRMESVYGGGKFYFFPMKQFTLSKAYYSGYQGLLF